MKPLMRDILTGANNESYAYIKVIGFIVLIVFLGLEIASFVMNRPFDEAGFGTGAGLLIGALGGGIKLSETSEPK